MVVLSSFTYNGVNVARTEEGNISVQAGTQGLVLTVEQARWLVTTGLPAVVPALGLRLPE